jgi:hypothetical protein
VDPPTLCFNIASEGFPVFFAAKLAHQHYVRVLLL